MGDDGTIRTEGRRLMLVLGILVCLGVVPILILLFFTGFDGGLDAESGAVAAAAIAVAFVPVIAMLSAVVWLDRYEPEPVARIAIAVGWGATLACALAVGLELLAGELFTGDDVAVMAGIVAPFVEEATKGLFLLIVLLAGRHLIDGVLDGLVYGGLVGIGFAFTENILYLTSGYHAAAEVDPGLGATGLTGTFVMRGVLSPFAHPLFSALLGAGVGLAAVSRDRRLRWAAPAAGYLAATLAHMCWNGSLVFEIIGFVVMYAAIMLPALATVLLLARRARRWQQQTLTAALHDLADQGVLPREDVAWASDVDARRLARHYAAAMAGPAAATAMTTYLRVLVRFGFLHAGRLRHDPAPCAAELGNEYVAHIARLRTRIAFPGQVVPLS